MERIKNVLFDLDGTLTDPAEGITNALMHAQRRLGRAVSPREDLFVFIGPPLIETFMSEWGLSREESEQALVYYREHFGTKGLFENGPYEGIGDCLARLKEAGLRLFVATSKPEPLSLRILEHFDLIKYFEAMAGSTGLGYYIMQSWSMVNYPRMFAGIIAMAVLGVVLLNVQNDYNFIGSVVYGITGGLGFMLAIVLFASVRERTQFSDYPECFEGFPICLVSAALVAMAFMGFSGMKIF